MIWLTAVWWRQIIYVIVASSNCVSCVPYQDINWTNGGLMLIVPMGNVINTWTEIQQFCCWLMIQYTVEPTMYPYSCILCGVKARISPILNSNLAKLVYLSMKEISVRNINITWNSDGRKWKHIIGPPTHIDKNTIHRNNLQLSMAYWMIWQCLTQFMCSLFIAK